MDFNHMNIQDVCARLMKDGLTLEQIGNLIGVSRLQVSNYISGKTKEPKPKVAFNIWKNIIIDEKPVLLTMYKSPDHLSYVKGMIEKSEE